MPRKKELTQEQKKQTNGYELSSKNPGWIKKKVPASYADEGLMRIVIFYVIYTPCTDLSSSGIDIASYGWGKNVWKEERLRKTLMEQAQLEDKKTFIVTKKLDDMKNACSKANLPKGFYKKKEPERIVIYQPSRYSQFMAVFYHIRNALAHGRLAMYPINDSEDIFFALEDGRDYKGDFQVRSRMLLKKSTLLRWIDIIEAGPQK